MCLYTTGRMEKYFEKPGQFIPERWIRDKKTGKNQIIDNYACLPFGAGVRSCIGRRVAEVQMQLLISRVSIIIIIFGRSLLHTIAAVPLTHCLYLFTANAAVSHSANQR